VTERASERHREKNSEHSIALFVSLSRFLARYFFRSLAEIASKRASERHSLLARSDFQRASERNSKRERGKKDKRNGMFALFFSMSLARSFGHSTKSPTPCLSLSPPRFFARACVCAGALSLPLARFLSPALSRESGT